VQGLPNSKRGNTEQKTRIGIGKVRGIPNKKGLFVDLNADSRTLKVEDRRKAPAQWNKMTLRGDVKNQILWGGFR